MAYTLAGTSRSCEGTAQPASCSAARRLASPAERAARRSERAGQSAQVTQKVCKRSIHSAQYDCHTAWTNVKKCTSTDAALIQRIFAYTVLGHGSQLAADPKAAPPNCGTVRVSAAQASARVCVTPIAKCRSASACKARAAEAAKRTGAKE